ncbi:MAG: MBL fold metallo-hydrolase [Firmicutes bacterium]|nr:MBL fold metallo-hydrolase [[Eubacterium] siraeum]MCM1488287.1 MBL fold metallo-hydrolase [Bacillota bacterium]
MKLLPICSSSKGNSTYIGSRDSGIAIDVGCSFKAFCTGLSAIGADIASVKAIVVTHEHIDHVKGLLTLTKHTNIPVYATEPTLDYLLMNRLVSSTANLHTQNELSEIEFDGEISCFPTPHDAAASVGYTVDLGRSKLGFCTDAGHVTEIMEKNLCGCRTVFIEANYQPEMLRNNPHYPPYLKQRISGDSGHLSNPDSADFCGRLVKSGTVNLILGHLSQENNAPHIAFNCVKDHLEGLGIKFEEDFTLNVAKPLNTEGEYIGMA